MHKILIAPLDWGLGHATRCIPIIRQLQKKYCHIFIAAEGAQLKLLQQEFPFATFLHLPGYQIKYAKSKRFFLIKILFQIPKILSRIKKENNWLKKIIDKHEMDAVISDNRYGLYSKKIPCVFMTHQLKVAAPSAWLEHKIRKINYSYIEPFKECWVPDLSSKKNLAGKLSHPHTKLPKAKYIGILSRFEKKNFVEKKYDWLIVLSGPEPQRTLLEKKLLNQIKNLNGKILFVRGKPESEESILVENNNCVVKNHLATNEMQQAFEESETIISRSGYTTVMEILSLQKKSILIPTPGQTEQEYLAKHLMKENWCYSFKQSEKDYSNHFNEAKKFNYQYPDLEESKLEKVIADLLRSLE